MKSLSKAVVPLGILIVLSGLFWMGYDAWQAAGVLAVGGLVLAVGLFDAFRWDG